MPAEPEVTLEQVREILEMLRRTIEGAATLEQRIAVVEKATEKTFDIVVRLQQHQEQLLDTFQTHARAQNTLNADFAKALTHLIHRIDVLENPNRLIM